MSISSYIKETLADQGRTQSWLYAEVVKLQEEFNKKVTGYKNFNHKMNNDTLDAYELVYISSILKINLNNFKKMRE